MSINQSHAVGGKGVIIFNGERILIFYDGVQLSLKPERSMEVMKGNHGGRLYLTTHRVIFVTNNQKSRLLSLSIPFTNMKEVDIKQPIFGANKIEGIIHAEANGGWEGKSSFSLTFNHGGAIEFGQALMEAGKRASRNRQGWQPPPYMPPPCANYYEAPPPAYYPVYGDPYYGFVPQHDAFSPPPPGGVYVNMAPPPYPGIYTTAPPPYYTAPPPNMHAYSDQPPMYAPGGAYPPPPPGSYPAPGAQPPQGMQYTAAPYPPANNGSNEFMTEAEQRKFQEAGFTQSSASGGFYDANNPNVAYSAPPPPYNPTYEDANKKKD